MILFRVKNRGRYLSNKQKALFIDLRMKILRHSGVFGCHTKVSLDCCVVLTSIIHIMLGPFAYLLDEFVSVSSLHSNPLTVEAIRPNFGPCCLRPIVVYGHREGMIFQMSSVVEIFLPNIEVVALNLCAMMGAIIS